MGALIYLNEF
ncbi:putative membrane protein, partial [Yersinia pestis PY-14]